MVKNVAHRKGRLLAMSTGSKYRGTIRAIILFRQLGFRSRRLKTSILGDESTMVEWYKVVSPWASQTSRTIQTQNEGPPFNFTISHAVFQGGGRRKCLGKQETLSQRLAVCVQCGWMMLQVVVD